MVLALYSVSQSPNLEGGSVLHAALSAKVSFLMLPLGVTKVKNALHGDLSPHLLCSAQKTGYWEEFALGPKFQAMTDQNPHCPT